MCSPGWIHKLLLGIGLFMVCADPGFGDGGFFPVEVDQIGNSALSPNQRAVVIYNGQNETLIVQVKYSGNVRDFAWVIPLPSMPDEQAIQTESDSIFTLLHDRSQPRVYRTDRYYGGRGGGGDSGAGMEVIEDENAQARVWQSLVVGPYDVHIISGNTVQAVRDWLGSNGYDYTPSSDPVLDFYVQKGWFFMATKVSVADQNVTNSSYQAGLPALKVTFPVDQPVFPLRISEISSARENEIEIYVVADHRMISDSYPTYAMNQEEVSNQIKAQIDARSSDVNSGLACACIRVTDPDGENTLTYDYESIFRNTLSSLPSGSFLIEHVTSGWTSWEDMGYLFEGMFDGFFDPYFPEGEYFMITRLRTILTSEEMADDVTFVPDPAGDDHLYLNTWINPYNPWQASTLVIPMVLLFPLCVSKKFRKRYGKQLILTAIALYLILV